MPCRSDKLTGGAMNTPRSLCEQLASIQSALAEDALEQLPQMLECYHLHLHAWLEMGIVHDIDALRDLRDLHWQTLAQLRRRQQYLRTRMQIGHYGGRAARTYLLSSPR